jgi:phosphonopyruvate decarboxylase
LIGAQCFVESARRRGFGLWAGVPCSYQQAFINYVISSPDVHYVSVANEGDAVAVAAGAEIGGVRGVAMFQNSGLGNAVNPLTSLTHTFRLPILIIVSLRGEPSEPVDEPQHILMGAITTRLLEEMEIPWEYFPTEEAAISGCLDRVDAHMAQNGRPYAFVLRKGGVMSWPASTVDEIRQPIAPTPPTLVAKHLRHEFLLTVQRVAKVTDVLIATTGYTGRELYALSDRPNQFYMVGSMGCASSLGLGLALARPDRRAIVLDGDGAALMRLGALAAIGRQRPSNLVHIVFDNGMHESTGGQPTAHPGVDIAVIAAACGYATASRVVTPNELAACLAERWPSPQLIHVPVRSGVLDPLPRPSVMPEVVAQRLRAYLTDTVIVP